MKHGLVLAQAGLVVACFTGFIFNAQAARPDLPIVGVHAFGGGKFLKKDDWAPAEDQFAYGGSIDFQPKSWPIALTAEYLGSNGKGDLGGGLGDFKGSTTEYRFGVKKFWRTGRAGRAFVGGGGAYVGGKGEIPSLDSSLKDSSFGGWFGGGYLFQLGSNFDLGIEASYSYAKIDIGSGSNQVSVNAGGGSIVGVAGFRW